jgi:hypothetical protein
MQVSNEIVQNDNGTILKLSVTDDNGVVDIRNSTVDVVIRYKNTNITKQATITDGINGKCELTLSSDNVSQIGTYAFQITVKFIDGKQFSSSNVERFVVNKKL